MSRAAAARRARVARESACKGACALEELLLPTYVWQRHAELIPASSPPLVLRVWGMDRPHTDPKLLQSVNRTVATSPGLEHLFGLKVARAHFGLAEDWLTGSGAVAAAASARYRMTLAASRWR